MHETQTRINSPLLHTHMHIHTEQLLLPGSKFSYFHEHIFHRFQHIYMFSLATTNFDIEWSLSCIQLHRFGLICSGFEIITLWISTSISKLDVIYFILKDQNLLEYETMSAYGSIPSCVKAKKAKCHMHTSIEIIFCKYTYNVWTPCLRPLLTCYPIKDFNYLSTD